MFPFQLTTQTPQSKHNRQCVAKSQSKYEPTQKTIALQNNMNSLPSQYVLPCSSSKRCLDRFSILEDAEEDTDGLVSLWPLLQSVLSQPINTIDGIIDVLETISNTLRGSSSTAGDYGTLKRVIGSRGDDFYARTWPAIIRIALRLPELFPGSTLPVLRSGDDVQLSTAQAGTLVSHQFLCTLEAPSWRNDFYDFSIWYDTDQIHPQAAEMYLTALFTYFDDLDMDIEQPIPAKHTGVQYSLHGLPNEQSVSFNGFERDAPLTTANIFNLESYSTTPQELQWQGPNGAVVVAANKDIGFGQSATQEEMYIGNCPEACPAVLFTPTLSDKQVFVINGARPMLHIVGQRRDISWSTLHRDRRCGGRMLLMDAMELDNWDDGGTGLLADLDPRNLERELMKAYTAFSTWFEGGEEDKAVVWTGLWGCGSFNGDPAVKMTLLWMAASLARKDINIICDISDRNFGDAFAKFIEQMALRGKLQNLRDWLIELPPTIKRLETIEYLK